MNWHEYFTCDPENGLLFWKARSEKSTSWNNRFGGKIVEANSSKYPGVEIARSRYYVHRIIYEMVSGDTIPDGSTIDHIDGNKRNNAFKNLRLCSPRENLCNRPKQANNTSGFKGVTWNKLRGKWFAQIGHKGRNIGLGYFDNPHDAHSAYVSKAVELHGKYHRV